MTTYTLSALAQAIGISRPTLNVLRSAGRLPEPDHVDGSAVRYSPRRYDDALIAAGHLRASGLIRGRGRPPQISDPTSASE